MRCMYRVTHLESICSSIFVTHVVAICVSDHRANEGTHIYTVSVTNVYSNSIALQFAFVVTIGLSNDITF